jgi:NADPH:quinone reductase-like Zn-dependent oxidoreductase
LANVQEVELVTTRRNVLTAGPTLLATTTFSSLVGLSMADDAQAAISGAGKKVVVLGGTGFVGSRVVEALVARGCEVVSVSKSGKPAAIAGADKVSWKAADVLNADISGILSGADSVISCIGTPQGSLCCFLVGRALLGWSVCISTRHQA